MNDFISTLTRRHFMGAAGAAAAGLGLTGCAANQTSRGYISGGGKTQQAADKSTVILEKNSDRRQGTYNSLKPLQAEVAKAIGEKRVIIKVNAGFPTEAHRIHSTYASQIEGILDFLRDFYDGEIIITEGVGSSQSNNIFDGFELYGYDVVTKEFPNTKLVDANATPLARKYIHQWKFHPTPIDIISMYFDPNNYIISAGRMKTHNAVVATYSLKNIVMGSPVGNSAHGRSQKHRMHGAAPREAGASGRELSYNLFTLALAGVYPDLGVVDGITGIEGDGPWDGTEVEHNIAVASTDFVACDRVCTELNGVDPFLMKYVEWCGDAGLGNWNMDNIDIVGAPLQDNIIRYEMSPVVEQQVAWIHENFEQ